MDISKLLEIANSLETTKSSKKNFESKNVDMFIEQFHLEPGTVMVPNELLFYTYRVDFMPSRENKVNKDKFFKVMHSKFPATRKNQQRYFLLKEGSININEERIKKAKDYDKVHWQKKRRKKVVQNNEQAGSTSNET